MCVCVQGHTLAALDGKYKLAFEKKLPPDLQLKSSRLPIKISLATWPLFNSQSVHSPF